MWKCFFSHKWSKWEQYQAEMVRTYSYRLDINGDPVQIFLTQTREKRTCARCGKVEDYKVEFN